MDRCAVLVDAGYLLGAAATLITGESDRSTIRVDHAALVAALIDEAARQSGLPVLRVLWYDGAPGGRLQPEHRALSTLPDTKVRLGELVRRSGRWQQKGVDSFLQRDLATLARNRAIADIVLVGGDSDLRRPVEEAQDFGVRLHLWGVDVTGGEYNQSQALVAEADRRWIMTAEWLRPFIAPIDVRPPQVGVEPSATIELPDSVPSPADLARLITAEHTGIEHSGVETNGAGLSADALQERRYPRLRDLTSKEQTLVDDEENRELHASDPARIGRVYGGRWAVRATAEQRASLLAQRPKLPRHLDGELLRFADEFDVDTWGDDDAKIAIRGAFWDALADFAAELAATSAP